MKWTTSDVIAFLAVVGNIIQATSLWVNARTNKKAEENRAKEQKQNFELQDKQIELEAQNDSLKSKVELTKAKLESKKELSKINLSNQQFSYDKAFPQAQSVFEKFVTVTKKALSTGGFPYDFPDDYDGLLSLVTLYCPATVQTIEDIKLINVPYRDRASQTSLHEEDYTKEMQQEAQAWFYDITQKLSNQLYHKPSQQTDAKQDT